MKRHSCVTSITSHTGTINRVTLSFVYCNYVSVMSYYYGRWGYVLYSDAYIQTTRALARHQLRSLARYQTKALDISTHNLYSACAPFNIYFERNGLP